MITILRNADVFAPAPLGLCTLVLGGGRILWMGAPEDAPDAANADWIEQDLDLAGAIVIPGFVDGHAHPTGGGGEDGPETRVPAPMLTAYTKAGVTTVVGMLGTDGETRSMESVCAATRALRIQGISAWCHTGGYHIPGRTVTGSLRGDITHIDEIIGVGELALSDFRSSQPTLDELLRIASEAQVAGMLTGKAGIVHMHMGDGPRRLELVRSALDQSEIPARVFHPTHVNRKRALFDEALGLTDRGCTIDVTAFPVKGDEDAWSAEAALGMYLDQNLPANRITVSSDCGGCLPVFDADGVMTHMDIGGPGELLVTVQRLVKAGRELSDVLPAFTSNPAQLLRLQNKGCLRSGADADLVVLDDALEIQGVMALGKWHVRNGEVVLKGTFEK